MNMPLMMDINEIRHRNVRMLVRQLEDAAGRSGERAGGMVMLAERMGKQPAQISHFAAEKPTKNIGEKIAREIEAAFGYEFGWLDWAQWEEGPNDGRPSRPVRFDAEMIDDVLDVLTERAKKKRQPFDVSAVKEFIEVYEIRAGMPTKVMTPRNVLDLAISYKGTTPQGAEGNERGTPVPAKGASGRKVGGGGRKA